MPGSNDFSYNEWQNNLDKHEIRSKDESPIHWGAKLCSVLDCCLRLPRDTLNDKLAEYKVLTV